MPTIVLTEEQARIVAEAKESVVVQDPNGHALSILPLMDSQDAEAVAHHIRTRGIPQETIPAAEVEAHLRKLEEISQRETLDEAKVLDLLRRMRAGEL
jgi:hypothetical protein